MNRCDKYKTLEERIRRANELGLCSRCSAVGHLEENCYGKNNKLKFACHHCGQYSHISAFCTKSVNSTSNSVTNHCINFHKIDNLYLLPTLTLDLIRGPNIVKVRCLLDTGSQRSYVSSSIANILCEDLTKMHKEVFNIKTNKESLGKCK